jgi:hypothetical protein
MKSSIPFLFMSWPESNPNSTNVEFSHCCSQWSQIDISIRVIASRSYWQNWTLWFAIFLQKCMTILVLSSWLKSRSWCLISWRHGSSSIIWRRPTTRVRIMILRRWPHPFCVDHSYLPQTSPCGQNVHPLLEEKIPYVRFCLPLIKNHQSYLTNLQHHATVGSLSLRSTKLSLVW